MTATLGSPAELGTGRDRGGPPALAILDAQPSSSWNAATRARRSTRSPRRAGSRGPGSIPTPRTSARSSWLLGKNAVPRSPWLSAERAEADEPFGPVGTSGAGSVSDSLRRHGPSYGASRRVGALGARRRRRSSRATAWSTGVVVARSLAGNGALISDWNVIVVAVNGARRTGRDTVHGRPWPSTLTDTNRGWARDDRRDGDACRAGDPAVR